jgi:putative membrane protein
MMKAETFFTEQEKKRISATVAEIEKKTSGEIAVMVVDRSDSYPEGRILGGLLPGCLAALIITHQFFDESLWYFLPCAILFTFVLGWGIQYVPVAFRFFVPKGRLEQEVHERALTAFYEKELYKTRDDTGVLFFLSLFERRVWVLADQGIYRKISQDELQTYASDIALGIKDGRACEALCHQIERVGQVLAEHFPVKPDDTNELSNEVIIGK